MRVSVHEHMHGDWLSCEMASLASPALDGETLSSYTNCRCLCTVRLAHVYVKCVCVYVWESVDAEG